MTDSPDVSFGPSSHDLRPIFILGMLQRTGTNHLWDLVALHPDVDVLSPIFEDHLLRWSGHLTSYVDDVTRCWSEEWEVPAAEGPALLRSLGDGVLQWIASHSDRRIATKMPSVEQLDQFFALFPGTPLVLLVRDGRSVCESGVKSFGWTYERAFRRWSKAADKVIEALERHGADERLMVVRFEDLVEDPAKVMRDICELVDLDVERYPYDQVGEAPVLGSSTLRSESGADIHWKPVERSKEFDPRERWAGWDDHRHRRFAEIAGAQHVALGYDLVEVGGKDSIRQRIEDRRDLIADARFREIRVKLGRGRLALSRIHEKI